MTRKKQTMQVVGWNTIGWDENGVIEGTIPYRVCSNCGYGDWDLTSCPRCGDGEDDLGWGE